MYIYLDMNDKERLKEIAMNMGIYIPYQYHHNPHGSLHQGNVTTVSSDTWLVELFARLERRISELEEKVGS
jgi:hypothetical protein